MTQIAEILAPLSMATLFGGMMLYSFGVAPMVFKALPGDDAAKLIRRLEKMEGES